MIYRVCSATNCTVIQWLCSILLWRWGSGKSQFLLMLCGKSCHPMPLQGQKEKFSMYSMAELYSIESRGLEGRQPIRISVDYTAAMWPRSSTEMLSSCLMAARTCLQRTWTRGKQQGKPEQLSPSQRTWKSHWRRIISSLTLRTSNGSSTCWVVFFRRKTVQPIMLKATPMYWLSRQP